MEANDDEVRRDPGSLSAGSPALSLDAEVPPRVTARAGNGGTSSAASHRPLDPGSIGKLIEQEVATLLEAAEAEADRISSKAMVVVRTVEERIESLQQELASAVAYLRALAERTERSEPPAQGVPPGAVGTSVPARSVEMTPSSPRRGIPAVLTEPPAAMREVAEADDPPALSVPASEEVVRLLREHLT